VRPELLICQHDNQLQLDRRKKLQGNVATRNLTGRVASVMPGIADNRLEVPLTLNSRPNDQTGGPVRHYSAFYGKLLLGRFNFCVSNCLSIGMRMPRALQASILTSTPAHSVGEKGAMVHGLDNVIGTGDNKTPWV
jgi:hypothetical protein